MKLRASILLSLLLIVAGCATRKIEPVRNPLIDRASRCLPASGVLNDEALRASAERARALLDDTVATLGNELPETRRQFIDLEEFPIQRYPRLTTPFIADPETLESSGPPHTPAWFVPLVLDPDQLGDVSEENLTGEFAFWLVPHGADVAQAAWQEVTDCLVREPSSPSEIVILDGGSQEFRGLVF